MTLDSSASSSLHKDEILRRTFSGAKWMLYLSASALAVGFGTNVMLGRIGPETLGFYSMLMLVVSMIQFFFVLGGSNVFVNYLPGLTLEEKPRFIFSYTVIVYVAGAALLAACLVFPAVLQVVFPSELSIPIETYVVVLTPILLAQSLVWALLQAELRGTALAISQNSVSWFYFINVGMLVLGGVIAASAPFLHTYIFVAVTVSNAISLIIGLISLKRSSIDFTSWRQRWFLPPGFWKFTLSLHFGTLFNFVIANAAAVFILRELGLRELGYFRAASVYAAFVYWIPSVFDKSFYPSFCNLVSSNHSTDEVYGRFSRLNATTSGIVALIILLFTRELLSVFGKEFGEEAHFLLIALSAGYLISMPFIQINFALVTAHLKTPHTMGAYAIGAASAIALYSVLVPRFGLPGIAASFIVLQLIMLVSSVVLTWHVTRSPFPMRAYIVAFLAAGLGVAGSYVFQGVDIQSLLLKLIVFSAFFVLLFATKLVTRNEAEEIVAVVLPGRVSRRFVR